MSAMTAVPAALNGFPVFLIPDHTPYGKSHDNGDHQGRDHGRNTDGSKNHKQNHINPPF